MDKRISNLAQAASLRRYRLMGGAAEGLEVIDCDNGRLRFLLNVSRGCDVMQLYHEGQNVSFISKNGFVGGNVEFPRRFEGGMVYTCGVDNAGRRAGYEMHGTYHTTPAEITRAECTEDGITVEATVRATALFGKNLVMRRRITAAIGSDHLLIEDTLKNEGYAPEEYCLLYHVNVGYPLLDEGARIEADCKEYFPCDDFAKETEGERFVMSGPVDNLPERCYYLTLGTPCVSLVNERLGKAFRLSYSADTLPCFLEWKSMASGDYALGLEPCTSPIGSRLVPRILQAGESVRFTLDLSVLHL